MQEALHVVFAHVFSPLVLHLGYFDFPSIQEFSVQLDLWRCACELLLGRSQERIHVDCLSQKWVCDSRFHAF